MNRPKAFGSYATDRRADLIYSSIGVYSGLRRLSELLPELSCFSTGYLGTADPMLQVAHVHLAFVAILLRDL
jgi:hypothetical protein